MLSNIQKKFKKSLLNKDLDLSLKQEILDDGYIDQRVAIYRNNVGTIIKSSLREKFIITEKIVGNSIFNKVIRYYIYKHPPQESSLTYYGKSFPEFIMNIKELNKFKFLFDLASFEWQINESYSAIEERILSLSDFTEIDENIYAKLVLNLRKTTRIFFSKHNIYNIWNTATIQTDLPSYIIITRTNYHLNINPISISEYKFLKLFFSNQTLSNIIDQCNKIPEFNFQTSFAKFVSLGIFATIQTTP